MRRSLLEIGQGQNARIVDIIGGRGLAHRLDSMGLRIGKSLIKVSQLPWRGPVTVKVGSTQLSLGRGMAAKLIVEVEEPAG